MADQNNLRKGPKLPAASTPTKRPEPGRVESIGPANLVNTVKESLKKGLTLGGAEGDKQAADKAKNSGGEANQDHILK